MEHVIPWPTVCFNFNQVLRMEHKFITIKYNGTRDHLYFHLICYQLISFHAILHIGKRGGGGGERDYGC